MFRFLIDCFEFILSILYIDFTKGLICEDRTLITICVITFLSLIFLYVTYRCFEWIIRRGNVGNIAKKSVFITGCDTGFGNLLAKALDQKGVLVYAGCLTSDGAEQLQKDSSSRLKTLIVDVLDKESITDALKTIEQEVKDEGLWGVVNNAGVMSGIIPFECNPQAVMERTILVNLVGPMVVTHTFLPLLRKSGGRLVNVCSAVSFFAFPGLTDYSSSKAGLKMFTSCLRREFYRSDVKVITVEPGGYNTNILNPVKTAANLNKACRSTSPDLVKFYGGNIYKKLMKFISLTDGSKLSNPQEVVDVMTHALLARRPRSRYLVGTDAKTFYALVNFLPEWIGDRMFGWPAPYGNSEK